MFHFQYHSLSSFLSDFQTLYKSISTNWYRLTLVVILILSSFAEQNAEQFHGKRLHKN